MSLLDRSPFAATDPDAPRLLEALYQTFDDVDVAKSLAEDAGVDTAFAEFAKSPSPRSGPGWSGSRPSRAG